MKKIIIIILIIIVAWFVLRFVIGGSEDTWICVDGEWVKHGVPSAPKPTKPCGDAKTCAIDSDCVIFGEDGDCNCGCFSKGHSWEKKGDCFCMAPRSCKCVNGVCEDVFEE